MKIFEPSICAASLLGPKQSKLFFSNKSIRPRTKGASGPTIVKSISLFFAKSNSPSKSSTFKSTFSVFGSSAVPAFPGATKTFSHKLL